MRPKWLTIWPCKSLTAPRKSNSRKVTIPGYSGRMPCAPEILKNVSLFALLDDDETAVLCAQVEVRKFAARQRIYKIGDPGERAYVVASGHVEVRTVDDDNQEVLVDSPGPG